MHIPQFLPTLPLPRLLVSIWLGLLILASSGFCQPALSQQAETSQQAAAFPEGPLGKVGERWFAAMEANDPEKIRIMLEQECTQLLIEDMESLVERLHAPERESFQLHSAGEDDETVWFIVESDGDWIRYWLNTAGEEHRVVSFGARFLSGPPPSPTPPTPRAPSAGIFMRDLDDYLNAAVAADEFSGVVYVARDGRCLYAKAFGEASKRYQVPNTLETRFNLGSCQKFLTALAVLRLVDDGLVDMDKTVGDYLPHYANKTVRDEVTIRHLLAHRSGLGTHFTSEFEYARRDLYRDFKDYVPLFVADDPEFKPGSDFQYSNVGYFILGMIIEEVSGVPYHEFVDKMVHGPAGMTDSGPFDLDGTEPRIATGYYRELKNERQNKHWRSNVNRVSTRGTPAGGTYATALDLARLWDSYMRGEIISPERRAEMAEPVSQIPGSSASYGWGLTIRSISEDRVSIGHTGGYVGVNAVMRVYPSETGYDTVIVLSNYEGSASAAAWAIESMLPPRDPPQAADESHQVDVDPIETTGK